MDLCTTRDTNQQTLIFGQFCPQIVNCDIAEVWEPLAIGLGILYQPLEVLAFLHHCLGELIHEVNHVLRSAICEFPGHSVLTLLHVVITCNPLLWPNEPETASGEPLPHHV